MKRIDINVSLKCKALYDGSRKFMRITDDKISQYHLYEFQAKFLDFVSRCVNFANEYEINRFQRLGPMEICLEVKNNSKCCKIHFRGVQYMGFYPSTTYGDSSTIFEISMIDMNDCPYFDYEDCYRDFKKYLQRAIL